MFTAEDIKSRMRQQPFVPVRIVTSAGDKFDVFHPDLVLVGTRDLIVGTASPQDASIYERVTRLSILHITAMEDLPVTGMVKNNGES